MGCYLDYRRRYYIYWRKGIDIMDTVMCEHKNTIVEYNNTQDIPEVSFVLDKRSKANVQAVLKHDGKVRCKDCGQFLTNLITPSTRHIYSSKFKGEQ